MWRLLATFLACAFFSTEAIQLSTIQVNLLYRHGDRSALRSFPKDTNNQTVWPQGYGQLTQIGMQQHYELGGYLKRRYEKLLSADYVNSEISVRSTDIDRTLMSAYSNLAGFYPPSGSQVWNASVRWQPVPVHTVPVGSDILLGQADCTRVASLMDETKNSPEAVNISTVYAAFFKKLTDLSGSEITDVYSVRSLYDTIYCEQLHDLQIPSWWQSTDITGDNRTASKVMSDITDLSFKLQYDSKEKQRLTAGTLVGQIRQNMAAMVAKKAGTAKMYMYSAHDTTVASLLSALNVYDGRQPPYTATVMVELQQDANTDGSLFVQIYYKNGTSVTEPVLLLIPGCADPCPLSTFLSLTESVVPADWNSECRNKVSLTQTEIIVISICACITLCLAMATIICYARRKRVTSDYDALPHYEEQGDSRR